MFSTRLKELRENAQLSQKAFSEILQIAQSTYALYELGKREPSLDVLCRISDYFKVSIDYLLGRETLYLLPNKDTYESLLSQYGPTGHDLHNAFMQLLNHGISIKKSAEVSQAIIHLKNCMHSLDTATGATFVAAREAVKQSGIPLLPELNLDGFPAEGGKMHSKLPYMLSFLSYHFDKATTAKKELSDLLDKTLSEYIASLLYSRIGLAYTLAKVEEETENGEHNEP